MKRTTAVAFVAAILHGLNPEVQRRLRLESEAGAAGEPEPPEEYHRRGEYLRTAVAAEAVALVDNVDALLHQPEQEDPEAPISLVLLAAHDAYLEMWGEHFKPGQETAAIQVHAAGLREGAERFTERIGALVGERLQVERLREDTEA